MKTKLQFLTATGLAAYLDAAMGMLIIYSVATLMSLDVNFGHLLAGSLLALLPDFDIILKGIQARLRGTWKMGDHRDTVMHKPIYMLPACTFVAFLLGGSFWAVTTFICLLYHYLHDSRWFSTGDIDWWATGKETPWMETSDWLRRYWLKPSSASIKDLGVGSLALVILAFWTPYLFLLAVPALTWLIVVSLWWSRGVFSKS